MIKLNIWVTLANAENLRVGELVVADPDMQGRLQGQFRYFADYLDHPEAFALDPIHLPLTLDNFSADRPHSGVHGVFEDSLPDDWGRRILARHYHLERNKQRVPHLLSLLRGQGMGALSYSLDSVFPEKSKDVDGQHLTELQRLARQFEEDATSIDEDLALLFQAGSSPGGARPKALIKDSDRSFLAKFSSIRDQFDVVALEAATMELARRAGVNTAPTKLVPCGSKKVLLVERFDIDNATMGRYHAISLQTLLKADGYYTAGYRDLADIIRRVSTNPGQDLLKLFKQLLFNILIGNTDDHLKNFCMIFDGENYKLSPAFDLVPNIGLNREHVLRIGYDNVVANKEVLFEEAKNFGIKQQAKANRIITAVLSEVSHWENVFREFGVPDRDIQILGRDIVERMARIKG
jgi:serine/threonine-protein kinase HipA